MKPLTRDEFRSSVFARDGYECVVCGKRGQDAHHLLERRLWPDGGYYLDNGVTLCGEHHLEAEMTLLSVEDLRYKAGITKIIVPPHLYADHVYDKWGNVILPNGTRMKGELFYDYSVQKILNQGGVLVQFTDFVKYPRTHHLPWSPGINDDDRVMDPWALEGKEVVVTEKMDGENTSMYRHGIHARSVDGRSHPSRDWVKNFWSGIKHDIPEGWRICGENLYAKHSILYQDLPSYFMGFSIWDDKNVCLDWDETLEWFRLLDITPVPVIFRGEYNEELMRKWTVGVSNQEGYVIRTAARIPYEDFKDLVGKWVRPDHVQTSKHWFYGQPVTPNIMVTD